VNLKILQQSFYLDEFQEFFRFFLKFRNRSGLRRQNRAERDLAWSLPSGEVMAVLSDDSNGSLRQKVGPSKIGFASGVCSSFLRIK